MSQNNGWIKNEIHSLLLKRTTKLHPRIEYLYRKSHSREIKVTSDIRDLKEAPSYKYTIYHHNDGSKSGCGKTNL